MEAMGGEGSNGFAAWKSFISLPIASPGPGWEEDSIVVNHPLLPYWVSFSKSNVCAVFVCVCVFIYGSSKELGLQDLDSTPGAGENC